MQDEAPVELLQQLLDACDEGKHEAIKLAEQTEIEALRAFLHESARQYRRAAEALCATGQVRAAPTRRAHVLDDANARVADIAAIWERAECEVLTYFRDAYDTPLPDPVADAVKRHFEAGVNRLERFRKLQSRLG
jgi:hypothetical protein